MSAHPNTESNKKSASPDNKDEKKRIDKSKVKFGIDAVLGKAIGTYNNDQVAYMDFTVEEKSSTLNIIRTVTMDKYRGNGLAGQITKALFQYAQEQKYTVTSDCWYTNIFLKKPYNGEYNKIYKPKL